MSIEVKVPQLPESVTDATVVAWNKKPGDRVERDENLVDLETDKVVLEVPAPVSGILKEILVSDDTTVTSGELLAIIEESAAPGKSEAAPESDSAATDAAQTAPADDSDVKTSPAVRRMLEEHGLKASDIAASGKDGRISKTDVQAHLDGGSKKAAPAAAKPAAKASTPVFSGGREERRVPMTRLRKMIAKRMVESKTEAAILTSFNEVDLTEVMALRAKYKEKFVKDHGVKLGFMSFFVKAATEALKKFPVVNASVEGEDIIYHDYCDVGVAISTPRGLMVPVLRNVEHMSFADVENGIVDYATQAREGSIGLDALQGGTFTVTNGGTFGSLLSTPIINPPQSAILGMHNIVKRPMVVGDEILARPMMYIALSYDHRIIDGRDAVLFLVTIKDLLEDPARLMLNI